MGKIDMRLDDREAIRDVLYRYCRGLDRRDVTLLKSCWFEDSIDQHPSFTGSGWEFSEYAIKAVEPLQFTQHVVNNAMIEFDGDRAFCESYVHAVHRLLRKEKVVDFLHYGRYCDILEKRGGDWKILFRLLVPDGDSMGEVEVPAGRAQPAAAPGARPYVRGVAGPSDPSYLRTGIVDLKIDLPPLLNMFEDHLKHRENS